MHFNRSSPRDLCAGKLVRMNACNIADVVVINSQNLGSADTYFVVMHKCTVLAELNLYLIAKRADIVEITVREVT